MTAADDPATPELAPDPRDKWTINHFSQSNGTGPGSGDVPMLLRRVAESIERLGDVEVQDIVFHSEATADDDDLTITVYYYRRDPDG